MPDRQKSCADFQKICVIIGAPTHNGKTCPLSVSPINGANPSGFNSAHVEQHLLKLGPVLLFDLYDILSDTTKTSRGRAP
jgi:hypothetical protein